MFALYCSSFFLQYCTIYADLLCTVKLKALLSKQNSKFWIVTGTAPWRHNWHLVIHFCAIQKHSSCWSTVILLMWASAVRSLALSICDVHTNLKGGSVPRYLHGSQQPKTSNRYVFTVPIHGSHQTIQLFYSNCTQYLIINKLQGPHQTCVWVS